MHELGHLLKLTYKQRKNTHELLGPHCINSPCIMRQDISGTFSKDTNARLQAKQAGHMPICPDCYDAGISFLCQQTPVKTKLSRVTNIDLDYGHFI